MFFSTKSALCCPSQRIWEYSRFSSSLFLREMSLSLCEWKSVNEMHKIKAKHKRFRGESHLPD